MTAQDTFFAVLPPLVASDPHIGTVDAMTVSGSSDFAVMRDRIHRAAQIAEVADDVAETIALPRRTIEMNLVIEMDDGSRGIFPAWRVQHSSTRAEQGMKGGLKMSLAANRDSVTALAAGMTIKCSVANLPLGGAKGGIHVDVHTLSAGEKARLIRRYAAEIAPDLGQPGHWVDIPAPDMGTTPADMAVFCDTISRLHGGFTPGVVTGKPVEIGGIPGRVEATGFGVAHIADLHWPLASRRVIVSGFGNVGTYAAVTASLRAGQIVVISDPFLGGVLSAKTGIPVDQLVSFLDDTGRSRDSFERFVATRPEVRLHGTLTEAFNDAGEADVFLPCAAPQSVDLVDAAALIDLGVQLVVEGANSPLMNDADELLQTAGVVVVPDVLANSGGVICPFLEMSKGASMTLPTRGETLERVGTLLTEANDRVMSTAGRYGLSDVRLAADVHAVGEIAAVHLLRGLY